jgi:catalase
VFIGDDGKVEAVLKPFIEAVGQHRVWSRRQMAETVPA